MTIEQVKRAFSKAIINRDCVCRIRDYEACTGALECSHYHTQGSSSALMFYPFNAFAQCSKHHFNHHNKKSCMNIYKLWLQDMYPDEYEYMETVKSKIVKYSEEDRQKIVMLCNLGKLDELARFIRGKLR